MTASPRPAPAPGRGPRLDADLHARPTGLPGLGAAMARAAARGLTDLGVAVPVPRDADRFDAYVGAVRAAGALTRTRIHCGVELRLGADGMDLPAYLPARLSRVDYVVLWPDRPGHVTAAALRTAAGLPVPVLLAAPLPAPAVLDACAGIAVEVSERRRVPSVRDARRLAAAGVVLVAGSESSHAAGIGRWVHVRAVAAALAVPVPHPAGSPAGTRLPAPGSTGTAPELHPGRTGRGTRGRAEFVLSAALRTDTGSTS